MKRRFSLILSVILALAIVAAIPFAVAASDKTDIGNVETGYTPEGIAVNNADDFAAMDANGTYYLANDITISATYAADFTGTLDGNGKTVTVSAPLFKNLKGTVKNLKLAGEVAVSDYDAGALAQRADTATVSNVLNSANVVGAKKAIAEIYNFTNVNDAAGTTADSTRLAGTAGLVGSATGVCTFTDCMNRGAINGSPAGGIVGVMGYEPNASSFTFVNCSNEGAITDNGCSNEGEPNPQGEDRGVAGIAGFAMDAKTIVFDNCHNTGDIDASFAEDGGSKAAKTVTGGIFGFAALATNTNSNSATLTVTGCTNNAAVKGSGQTGGIVGYNGKCNMTLKDSENKADSEIISTTSYIGGIAGRSDNTSTIENCNNYGSVFSAASGNMGGIVGYTGGSLTVKNCTNHASVDVSACGRPFGGILGSCEANATTLIDGCKNLGNIISGGRTGGIAAEVQLGTVKNCVNEGDITTAYAQSGGIVGRTMLDTTVENCLNNGNVISSHTDTGSKGAIGGIVGYANTRIFVYDSVNNGNIESPKTAVGGMVGNVNMNGTFDGCLNTGDIKGTKQVGGIVGYFGTKGDQGPEIITYCGNTGNITATAGVDVAAIAGYVYGGSAAGTNETTLMYCFSTGTVTGKDVGAAIGYINSGVQVAVDVKYNFFCGALVKTDDAGHTFIVYNKQNDAVPKLNMEHNYYPEGYAELEKYLPGNAEGKDKSVAAAPLATAASFASGEIAFKLNEAIKAADATITADVFYQTLGTDATPVLDNTHKAVIKNADGSYANATEPVTPPEVTTPGGDNTTTEPDVTTTVPDVTTTVPDVTTTVPDVTTTVPGGDVTTTEPVDTTTVEPPVDTTTAETPVDTTTKPADTTTEPEKKGCGGFAIAAQLVALLGTALTVVVIKKKA